MAPFFTECIARRPSEKGSTLLLHGGEISFESQGADQGTEFTIRLPAVKLCPDTEEVVPDIQPAKLNKLVLVEDIDDAREMFATLLELRGLEIHEAADGREGLDLIRRVQRMLPFWILGVLLSTVTRSPVAFEA